MGHLNLLQFDVGALLLTGPPDLYGGAECTAAGEGDCDTTAVPSSSDNNNEDEDVIPMMIGSEFEDNVDGYRV